jgi:hypothetical protein
MRAGLLAFIVVMFCASHSFAQQCLHGPSESPEQAARRRQALAAARLVNTMQANQPGGAQRRYLRHEDLATAAPNLPATFKLAPTAEIVAGWRMTLDVSATGYWFAITDTTDPCGYRYISTEDGLILSAEPIR